ncbi:MAG TPA: class I SAM-dependent methyltransferase [Candidatus Competibacteraceae bacterium]|nr:class I SAM-dependent methyltransferase [Candidatus Competibacteraceae bacterium]
MNTLHSPRVAVRATLPALQPRAAELAERLGLSLLPSNATPGGYTHLLELNETRLALLPLEERCGPIYVDFLGGTLGWRRRHGGDQGQALARAVGLKGGQRPDVLDATAGLGRDGFVLACLGARVRLVERSPIIAALLEDGLQRALADPELGPLLSARLTLTPGSGSAVMAALAEDQRPEVVYLDPMYPHRDKSALVKKEMRVLRRLVGDDEDAPALLTAALRCARHRVVVKRPRLAPVLEGPRPSHAITAKSTRYDVYLTEPSAR